MRRFSFLPWLLASGATSLGAGCAPTDNVFGNASSAGGGATITSSAATTGDGGAAPQGVGGSGVGGSGQGGQTTGGPGGGAPACEAPGDCDDPDGECTLAACEGGTCGEAAADQGTRTVEQNIGDCRAIVCDGEGGTEEVDDDGDFVDDDNACTIESCDDGELRVSHADEGTPCGEGLFCDDDGQCAGCTAADECPGTDDECKRRTCDEGTCGVEFSDAGLPLEDDEGNCLALECDGEGNASSLIDDADLPLDDNECTDDVCNDGVPDNPPLDEGTSCSDGVCDGDGECLKCIEDTDCGLDSACAIFDCNNQNTCDAAYADPGDPADDPVPNDCVHDECDGAGGVIQDVPDDAGDSCGGNSVCDGNGSCVECSDDGDCNSDLCRCGVCVDDASLFFSQYIEGTNNNKGLEIYNATSDVVDLGDCDIERYSNGSSVAHTTLALSGSLDPGEAFVVCNTLATFVLGCDQSSAIAMDFNGNDTLLLVCGGTDVDAIGRFGEDPGVEWGTGMISTADNTLYREPGIFVGDANPNNPFTPADEWRGAATDTTTGLGSHDPCSN